ncbi:S-layer homology domain-containing protein [Cohnella suwonensis]|uniref:S-layer homology domain-containing protein n=1 Tax=Cohnella suwonensis TaxID=696072 RepID=A0ABW0LTL7_9BACL
MLTADLSVSHGKLTLADANGLTLEDGANDSAHVAYAGSADDLNAALDGLTYVPDPDYAGYDSITFTVSDTGNGHIENKKSTTRVYPIQVDPVNDAPSFFGGMDQIVEANASAQSVPGWATGMSAGPASETDQQLTFEAIADRPELFSAQPAISGDGTLSYTPAENASGVAEVTVTLRDNGGIANGGIDASTEKKFKISILNRLVVGAQDAEVAMKDGEFIDPTNDSLILRATNGTWTSSPRREDVVISGMPEGLDYSVSKTDAGELQITLSGSAASAVTSDISLGIVVRGSAISGTEMLDAEEMTATLLAAVFDPTDPTDPSGPTTPPVTPPVTPPTSEPSDATEAEPEAQAFDVYADRSSEWTLNNVVKIVFPAGTIRITGQVSVSIASPAQTPPVGNLQALSPTVELTSTTGSRFSAPVTLIFLFDATLVANGYRPAVYYYDETLARWTFVGGEIGSDGTVTIQVNHFTKFAVFGARTIAFPDLQDHWASAYVDRLAGMNVVQGDSTGRFQPNASVTRAQFTKMLAAALGLTSPETGEADRFADDNDLPAWSREAITALAQAGWMRGSTGANGAKQFKPNVPISRAEMATILASALKADKGSAGDMNAAGESALAFKDADRIPAWAREAAGGVVAAKLMNGSVDRDGKLVFRPGDIATRAEAAATIYKLLQALYK